MMPTSPPPSHLALLVSFLLHSTHTNRPHVMHQDYIYWCITTRPRSWSSSFLLLAPSPLMQSPVT